MLLAAATVMLVSTEWLGTHLKDEGLVILHVGSTQDYEKGHIPGARLVGLGDISITGDRGLRLELPPAAALEAAFGKLGISDRSRIVIYPGTDSVQSATRVWFTLDYVGAGGRSSLLDGGLALWRAEGRPLSTETPPVEPKKFTARPRPELVVDAAWVRAHLEDPGVLLLDARTAEYYTAGHIPGARNVTYSTAFDENRRLRPEKELRELLGAGKTAVPYCHIGQQATVLYFVARYLGLEARLYDGSFQDWSSREKAH